MPEGLTVDEILKARSTLRERALECAAIEKQVEDERRHDEEQDIIILACEWLREELDCTEAEIEDLDFIRGPYNSDGSKRQVVFVLDGVRFRASLKQVKVAEYTTNGRNESVTETAVSMYVTKTGNAWHEVKSLGDVGRTVA